MSYKTLALIDKNNPTHYQLNSVTDEKNKLCTEVK